MSWTEQIGQALEIKTGDGKTYRPLWSIMTKEKEYNIAEFEFPEISGTRVERKRPKGGKYTLEIVFQGETHTQQAREFETSADDPRPWTIAHPFYGQIYCQPSALTIDPTGIGSTRITVPIIETIADPGPKSGVSAKDKVLKSKGISDEAFAVSFEATVTPTAADISKMTTNNAKLYQEAKNSIKNNAEFQLFVNYYNEANSRILEATEEPKAAIQAFNNFINYPPQLISTPVKTRVNDLRTQLDRLSETAANLTTYNDKKTYETQAGAIVGAIMMAASLPAETDYLSRADVTDIIDQAVEAYDEFIDYLDTLQATNGATPGNYIPDPQTIIALNDLTNYTLANLFEIALGAKQERTTLLEEETNIILLAHRYYGNTDDDTLDRVLNTNNWGLEELITVDKGTKFKYLV